MKTYKDYFKYLGIDEEAPTNNIGGGAIASKDIVYGKKKKQNESSEISTAFGASDTFASDPVFDVDNTDFDRCKNGKTPYARWNKFLDPDTEIGRNIKTYAQKNSKSSVVLRNKEGSMLFLRKR